MWTNWGFGRCMVRRLKSKNCGALKAAKVALFSFYLDEVNKGFRSPLTQRDFLGLCKTAKPVNDTPIDVRNASKENFNCG